MDTPNLTQKQLYRMISPAYSNACRSAEQAWRLHAQAVDDWCEGAASHEDVQMALEAAIICDKYEALTYDYAGIDYGGELMAPDLRFECGCNGVNSDVCPACLPLSEAIPF